MRNKFAIYPVLALMLSGLPLWACSQCRPAVFARIYDQDFAAHCLLLLLPLAVLLVLATAIHFSSGIRGFVSGRAGRPHGSQD